MACAFSSHYGDGSPLQKATFVPTGKCYRLQGDVSLVADFRNTNRRCVYRNFVISIATMSGVDSHWGFANSGGSVAISARQR